MAAREMFLEDSRPARDGQCRRQRPADVIGKPHQQSGKSLLQGRELRRVHVLRRRWILRGTQQQCHRLSIEPTHCIQGLVNFRHVAHAARQNQRQCRLGVVAQERQIIEII